MQERQPGLNSTELLRCIARGSSEAEWTTEELQEALREGGVAPERLVSRILTEVQQVLNASTAVESQAPLAAVAPTPPLLGLLQARTQLPPSAIARAMDVPVTFLSAVSRHAPVVPHRWQRELARRAEQALQVQQHLVMEALAGSFQAERAASRETPYSTDAAQSYEDILAQSTMSDEVKHYWRTLATEAAV
jgi:hypothetical protein